MANEQFDINNPPSDPQQREKWLQYVQAAAALYSAYSANRAQNQGMEAQQQASNRALEESRFQPYTVRTSMGGARFVTPQQAQQNQAAWEAAGAPQVRYQNGIRGFQGSDGQFYALEAAAYSDVDPRLSQSTNQTMTGAQTATNRAQQYLNMGPQALQDSFYQQATARMQPQRALDIDRLMGTLGATGTAGHLVNDGGFRVQQGLPQPGPMAGTYQGPSRGYQSRTESSVGGPFVSKEEGFGGNMSDGTGDAAAGMAGGMGAGTGPSFGGPGAQGVDAQGNPFGDFSGMPAALGQAGNQFGAALGIPGFSMDTSQGFFGQADMNGQTGSGAGSTASLDNVPMGGGARVGSGTFTRGTPLGPVTTPGLQSRAPVTNMPSQGPYQPQGQGNFIDAPAVYNPMVASAMRGFAEQDYQRYNDSLGQSMSFLDNLLRQQNQSWASAAGLNDMEMSAINAGASLGGRQQNPTGASILTNLGATQAQNIQRQNNNWTSFLQNGMNNPQFQQWLQGLSQGATTAPPANRPFQQDPNSTPGDYNT